jgi:Xaa-Pro aminopeptidase
MRYLTGWKEGGHERFVGLFVPAHGEPTLVVPAMNAPQARDTPAGIKNVIGWSDETGWHDAAIEAAGGAIGGTDTTILVDDELHAVHLLNLQGLFPESSFLPIGYTMAKLREIKTKAELASMKSAAELIDAIIEEAYTVLREGMTELELQAWFLDAFRRYKTQPSFTPTCCFGANGALPHHHTGETRLKAGDVLVIDVGCISDGYASDITRTFAFKSIVDPEAFRVYDIVMRAHTAARTAAVPHVFAEEVDWAARKLITDAGYGEQFMHRTGHGIGLSTHEPPYIVKGNREPLESGMCFSIEPGVYLPGRFGVRIENIVTMTPTGVKSLNAEPAEHLRVVG